MGVWKIVGVILIAGGVLVLVYGGFSYTKKTHKLDLGVAELKVAEKEKVQLPIWAGVGLIAGGVCLLAIPRK